MTEQNSVTSGETAPESNIVEQIALHFFRDGSDKLWAGAYTTAGDFLSCWGRRGAALQKAEKNQGSQEAARKVYEKKVGEKQREGYVSIPFNHVDYGVMSWGPVAGAVWGESEVDHYQQNGQSGTVSFEPVYVASHVLPLEWAEVEEAILSPAHGITEKVNGERTIIAYVPATTAMATPANEVDSSVATSTSTSTPLTTAGQADFKITTPADGRLHAYNRKGTEVFQIPAAACSLTQLGHQFVLDGERLTGKYAGQFVIFDLLEWDGEDVRRWPYHQRITLLEAALLEAGLIAASTPIHCSLSPTTITTPASADADTNADADATGANEGVAPASVSTAFGTTTENSPKTSAASAALTLLKAEVDPVKARQVIDTIQQMGAEGIVVRTLNAPYEGGDTRTVRKFKFLSEVDAIVIGVKPGMAAGSVRLGLVRPGDGAVIEVGNVRSGLNDAQIARLEAALAGGTYPVLRVEYLGARTVGIRLVEPKTSYDRLRTDKLPQECLCEQMGPDKAGLFEKATPVAGLHVSQLRQVSSQPGGVVV